MQCRCLLLALAVSSFLPLSGCSGPDLVNAFVPDEGYRLVADLPYGQGPRQRYDLYIPEGARGETPTIVFLYGGGWDSGAKEDYLFAGEAFASRGYVTAIPDYRLYPEVRYPAFLEDSAAAVSSVLRNLGTEEVSAGPLYLVGHSAGAYNVVMLSLDGRWLAAQGLDPCGAVAATAGLAGPYDFLPLRSDRLKAIFGAEESRGRTQPIEYARADAPPLLLVAGRDDTTVDPENSARLAARAEAAGGRAETLFYEDIGHVALVGALASSLRDLAPVLEDVDAFLSRHPKPLCGGAG